MSGPVPPPSRHDEGLQTLVDAAHGRGDLPAVALAVLDADAEVVAWAGSGEATDAGGRVRLASITKTVVALTVHRLAAEGTLPLEEPIGGGACVADVLSHTAGMPMELAGTDWATDPPADAADLAARIAAEGVTPELGPFRYSNVAYWWLDGLLAARTGQSTEANALATLAGHPHTGAIDFGEPTLHGHLVTPGGRLVPNVVPFAPARRSSGGLTADLPSIAWLGRAILRALAVSPQLGEQRATIATGWGWTAGLERWTTAGRALLGHHGSWGGTRTLLVVDPADGRAAVACATTDVGNPVIRGLMTAIGMPVARPRRAAAAVAAALPLGDFADTAATARLTVDPDDPDAVVLEGPLGEAPQHAVLVAPGLAELVDGPHAGEPLTTPDGVVLRVGVRSLDPAD